MKTMILKDLQDCALECDVVRIEIEGDLTLNDVTVPCDSVSCFNLTGGGREVEAETHTSFGTSIVHADGKRFVVPTVCLGEVDCEN